MLHKLLLILAGLWLIPRVLRLLVGGRPERGARRAERPRKSDQADRLRDLTHQEISDAEFEEIPPEE